MGGGSQWVSGAGGDWGVTDFSDSDSGEGPALSWAMRCSQEDMHVGRGSVRRLGARGQLQTTVPTGGGGGAAQMASEGSGFVVA